jgi:hypothetical protein
VGPSSLAIGIRPAQPLEACIPPIDKMLFMRRLRLRCDAQIVEEGLHADAEGLVVLAGSGPVRGFASAAGTAGAGDDRREDGSRNASRAAMVRAASGGM